MEVRLNFSLLAICAALLVFPISAQAKPKVAAPTITQVAPSCATAGKVITLTGTSLNLATAFSIKNKSAQLKQKSKTSLRIVVPKGLKDGFTSIKVTTSSKPKTLTIPFRVNCGADLQLVKDSAVTASTVAAIGTAGGSVAITDVNNSKITFVVPPGAVQQAMDIKVSALKTIAGFPFSGGLLGAVSFEPDGLQFGVPAVLTIPLPKKIPAGMGVIGFLFDGSGQSWRVVKASKASGVINVPIEHFSGGGAALVNIADFVAAVTPILSSINPQAAPLSLSGIEQIEELVGAWSDQFPPNFCAQSVAAPLCALAEEKIRLSAEEQYRRICPAGSASLPSPSLIGLADLAGFQAALIPRTGGFSDFDSCLERILTTLVDDAERAVLLSARLGTIGALVSLSATADTFGQSEVALRAVGLVNIALRELVEEGVLQCATNPQSGLLLLGEAQSLSSQFAQTRSDIPLSIQEAIDGCVLSQVKVTPRSINIVKGASVDFGALINGVLGNATWSVTGGGSITNSGFFTSSGATGSFTVTATSNLNPSLSGSAKVFVIEPPSRLEYGVECFTRVSDRQPVVRFRSFNSIPVAWRVIHRDPPITISNATKPGLGIVAVAGQYNRLSGIPFASIVSFEVEMFEPIGGAKVTLSGGWQKLDGEFYRFLANCNE